MIRSLRQRHRRIFLLLSAGLPLAFVAGLALREPVPTMETLPLALDAAREELHLQLWQRDDLWPENSIDTSLLAGEAGQLAILLSARKELVTPDPIVYWKPATEISAAPLSNAILLGAYVDGQRMPLPEAARHSPGSLLLYSLADQSVFATSTAFVAQPQ